MGTNCSLFGSDGCCASATLAVKAASRTAPHSTHVFFCIPAPPLMRKWPESEFFLGRVPQARQTIGLDNENENDQPPKDHEFKIGNQIRRHGADKQGGGVVDQHG